MLRTSNSVVALMTVFASLAFCDQGSFVNSTGSTAVSSSILIDSTVASPTGPLTVT
jgi:hypothetical protein